MNFTILDLKVCNTSNISIKIKKIGDEKGVPVDTINPMHYGSCNGKEVLRTALHLISK